MRRFTALLTKEIKELLTLQMLIPLLVGILFFVLIGNIIGSEGKKAGSQQSIAILDLDATPSSKAITDLLSKSGFTLTIYKGVKLDTALAKAGLNNIPALLTIPQGFEEGIGKFKSQQVNAYSIMKGFSLLGSISGRTLDQALKIINEYVGNIYISKKASVDNPEDFKNPVKTKDYLIIGDKTANINPGQITSFIISQTTFTPIIMFIVIVFASQMIAVTIASEKENKTLETLLSTPISRISLVSAKMIAAGFVSLLMAVVYMLGFRYYLNGITGSAGGQPLNTEMSAAVKQLGLTLDTYGYALLGTSLFLSILIALAISLILGAFAEDVKKAQGFVTPILFLIMIPYLLTMFVDLNSTTPLVKYFIYAIPFSHPFLASPNLFLHRYELVIGGILYELIVFLILVIIAAGIFSTDRILTMKLSFGKKTSLFRK